MRDAMTPEVAYVLALVRQVVPSAIIAGGYLRDRANYVEPKDVDIFVSKLGLGAKLGLKLRFLGLKRESFSGYLEYTSSDVCGVYSLATAHDHPVQLPVQLIEVSGDPVARIREHDFGICQIYHDGTDLHVTDAFLKDHSERTFTLRHCESQSEFNRSMKRFARISSKYPGYELVIPEEFKQWM